MTASASRYSGACAEPIVSRQPRSVRASSRTIALARTVAPEATATAPGSRPSPPASVVNTEGRAAPFGPPGPGGGQQRSRRLGQ